ncbi:carboxymuconolactone decarboxylase family protein [Mycobacterium nebraskense]|uniref:4-carboxymuconolactone decarboxylase n=1 Tax=Mycobacterium nebraskense TaxID=244292 RepID=A0A0F5NFD4_9MYCO|nr:carboxymuconolactone decarboxylase family protein [Mycobacterium nebraskense]KKC05622.1 4-carboxymuconolactone decarboxylase [Mycobacterium nebraskense]KLO42690.1 4-carboxymuconolactone decarboxylase [Mycobacterium nebraskense]MBI2694036.1 carboxymuconolactone decarboxylase family protein [Mycobacterium nebraskense]MCV7119222.1 carboxymuconolactone decarboxylase family protein [Mycobacterium nebraskense]ORW15401.1 4-carboxymuconolactone decarboxylase [Mycobacterium nebraskense]
MTGAQNGRIPSGRFRELGPINWVLAKAAARTVRAPEMHLFTTLGQHRLLFLAWSVYSGRVLRGRLPAIDTELVILRVAHVRGCEYELQHHRRMAAKQGLDADLQAAIFAWPERLDRVEGRLTVRQQALLTATDEFVKDRTIGDATWRRLAEHLDRRQLIEFCLLASQYDGLAATMAALDIPLDNPR